MPIPPDRKYLQTHEWHLIDGDTATIGITQIAADELTDITFVDLPAVGDKLKAAEPFGEIESVKATSDLYTGVTGQVTAVNDQLDDHPDLVNSDPYGKGWMIKVKMTNPAEAAQLLSADQYAQKAEH